MTFLRPLHISACVLLASALATSCKPTQTTRETVLMKINDEPIMVSEFKYVYEKSVTAADSLYLRKSVQDYLEMFTNFKLRVAESKTMGLDTTSDFRNEYATYQEQLAQPYFANPRFIDSLTREAYQRLQSEVYASHILVGVASEANPADTLVAYKKMEAIRERAQKGEDFANLAYEVSEDPSAKQNKGSLGYFTALQMVYGFENYAYKTPVGKISPIFRTEFGYHIMKVHDKRPSTGTLSVAHIMAQVPQKNNPDELNQALKRLEEVYARLQRGESWEELCKKYSDDGSSKNNGGRLPDFKVGEVVPEFEANALTLKSIDEYTKPFRTNYGFHIVKLLGKKGTPSFAEIENTLHAEVQKDSRAKLSKAILVKQILKENKFKENSGNLKEAFALADSRLPQGSWSYDVKKPIVSQPLFSLSNKAIKFDKVYTVKDFFDFVYEKQVPKQGVTDGNYVMLGYYEKFKEEVAFSIERKLLSQKYPDYRMLLNEYKEGILYFELMRQKVWNRAIEDTLGAKDYFSQNREKYNWDTRVNATVYQVANDQVLGQLKGYLNRPIYPVYHIKSDALYFSADKSTHEEAAINTLNVLVNTMKKNPDLIVEIAGHVDEKEKRLISMDRIRATVSYLTFKGIQESRISTKDFGSSKAASTTDRLKNRRVE